MSSQNKSASVLVASGICKNYGATRALVDVDLTVNPGEVVALVGENGAGKSTLGKIIAGVTERSAGKISWRGSEVNYQSSLEALHDGIAIVLQEFNLIPEMTVAENIYLTREDGYQMNFWRSDRKQIAKAKKLLASLELDFQIDPAATVEQLSVAKQQMVEIVRAISVDADLFILDEPTAALGRAESEQLLETIRQLRNQGNSVIIVTHRLDEVYAVADRIVVLRDGHYQGDFDPSTTSSNQLVAAMVGRELDEELSSVRHAREPGDVLLEVKDLEVAGSVGPVSLQVRSGEIVGLAGLVGSGRTELLRAIFAADKKTGGQVFIDGKEIDIADPRQAASVGMALVTEDRKTQGLLLELPIYDNATLSRLAVEKKFVVNHSRHRKQVKKLVQDLLIKVGSINLPAMSLSGGNQQKVVLAKWLNISPRLLLLDEPTRGVDVGARADFYRIIDELVDQGLAVLMVSSELPEVIALSDRILVMSGGKIVAQMPGHEATEEGILNATEIASTAVN